MPHGTPSNADVTVVTTAGDGGGLYSVSLSTDEPSTKNYDGEDNEVTWDVDVGEQWRATGQCTIGDDIR